MDQLSSSLKISFENVGRSESVVMVETVDSADVFESMKDEWNELLGESAADNIFLTWEWLFLWWRHLSEDRSLHIVTVRREGRLIALAPLGIRPCRFRRMLPFRVLEFLGSGSVGSDYLDLIIRRGHEREALKSLSERLNQRKLMLELSQIERTSGNMVDLALDLGRNGWVVSRETTNFCPFIDLSGHTWDSYLASLSRAHRYNFRRRLKKLERHFGHVRFDCAETEAERREALKLLVELHLERWSARGGSDALHTSSLIEFHESFSRAALRRGWLRLYVLRLGGKAVAALYGLSYKGTFSFYQSGFDPEYGKWSVGLVIMGLAIKSALEEGAEQYDMLHGDEGYKFHWAREERELVRLKLYPPRTRGQFYQRAMDVRWGVKKMIWRWLPRRLGDRIAPGRRLDVYWNTLRKRSAA